jgi:hypothetical protein
MGVTPLSAPTHYSRFKIQPIEVIEQWGLGFHPGNVVKYIARSPHAGNEMRDLRKAKWYLDRWIAVREAQMKSISPPAPEPQE